MEKKVDKAFMITPLNNHSFKVSKYNWFVAVMLIVALNCKPDLADDPMPFTPFPDFEIILSNYQALQSDGGFIYRSEGVRGIIIYRKNSSTFLAFERNCSFQPNDACATVDVEIAFSRMLDSCCGSSFNFDGNPTGGPAWRPLRQYTTIYSASTSALTVTDQIK
jgi:hypothetical protein